MNNQELLNKIEGKKIILRGYGVIGEYLYRLIRQVKNADLLVCEKNSKKEKWLKEVEKIDTISFEDAVKMNTEYVFVVASFYNKDVITSELKKEGIPYDRIIYGVTDEAWRYYLKEEEAKKRIPLKELQFEIDVAMHCNLDCNCCSQFGPIAKKEFVNISSMEKDFKRLNELFDGKAKRIYLIGGEPLLNKEINRCVEIARNNFKTAKIDIFTNGLLLFKIADSFWESCRQYKIGIIVTKYPVNVNYDKMKKLVEDHGLNFEFFGASEDFKYMTPLGLDVKGKQKAEESFALCSEANNCIKLRDGRLYTCTRPVAIYKFNEFFKTDLQVSDSDSIDIYEAKNAKEILDFLSHPIPFCRYCDNRSHKEAREWCHSKKVMEEWT